MSRVTYLIPLSTESSPALDFAMLSALIVVSFRATKQIAHDAFLILTKSPDVRRRLSSETAEQKRFRSLSNRSIICQIIYISNYSIYYHLLESHQLYIIVLTLQ